MKEVTSNLNATNKFNSSAGYIKFGAGIVFSEAHYEVGLIDRAIASGWALTVGIVGWSLGGGHGPFSPAFGLGSDNILEAEIVLGDGSLVTVNSEENNDLFWALRGGGGSTWGVIVSITVRLHFVPKGGFTIS
jgi:ribonuclease T2